jgi:hypothetical protein
MEVRNDNEMEFARRETVGYQSPRSTLYNLLPIALETPGIESLTSYINRLAWKYRVEPRILVAQEIVPHLGRSYHFQSSPDLLSAFCRSEAMSMNGAGECALDWSETLARLTMRGNLRGLTLRSWAGKIPPRGLLREAPAWCPACYHEWRENRHTIYQPLLWMLQIVTVCLRHRRRLHLRCFHCQKKQSVIASRIRPGYCTQCMAWLGIPSDLQIEDEVNDETCDWQQWVLAIIEEFRCY